MSEMSGVKFIKVKDLEEIINFLICGNYTAPRLLERFEEGEDRETFDQYDRALAELWDEVHAREFWEVTVRRV